MEKSVVAEEMEDLLEALSEKPMEEVWGGCTLPGGGWERGREASAGRAFLEALPHQQHTCVYMYIL